MGLGPRLHLFLIIYLLFLAKTLNICEGSWHQCRQHYYQVPHWTKLITTKVFCRSDAHLQVTLSASLYVHIGLPINIFEPCGCVFVFHCNVVFVFFSGIFIYIYVQFYTLYIHEYAKEKISYFRILFLVYYLPMFYFLGARRSLERWRPCDNIRKSLTWQFKLWWTVWQSTA